MLWLLVLPPFVLFCACYYINCVKRIAVTRKQKIETAFTSQFKFNNAERAFLTVLEKGVGSNYYVIGKVKAFDLLQIENRVKIISEGVDKLFATYIFDYVICEKSTNQIVCVVELEKVLNVKRSWLLQRKKNLINTLMQDYCLRCDLSRLQVAEQRGYMLNELIERFEAVIGNSTASDYSSDGKQDNDENITSVDGYVV
ncbi:MAG: hypothetical protein ACI9ES_000069 [Oceanospirillaceae bacterium]|jgi:hypothetical protein